MREGKSDVLQGTLDLMVLKTLESMGSLHGYGMARRIEQVSEDILQLNQGTIYASLVRLLLKMLPFQEPKQLAMLTDPDKRGRGSQYCYRMYTGLRKRNAVFPGLLARSNWHQQFFVAIAAPFEF